MNEINKIRNRIQDQAVDTWYKTKIGTAYIPTGLGKTFVCFKAIQKLYKDKELKKGDELIFAAERIRREETFFNNATLFNELYNFDIYKTFNVKFIVYNTARTWVDRKFKFVLLDKFCRG